MAYIKKEIPKAIRVRNTVGAGLITLSILACLAYLQYDSDQLRDYWYYLLVVPAVGIPMTLSNWFTKSSMERVEEKLVDITAIPEMQASNDENIAAPEKQANNEEDIFAPLKLRWYYRYPIAFALFLASFWIAESANNYQGWMIWIASGALALYGLIIAKELGLLVLTIVSIYTAWYFGKDFSGDTWQFIAGFLAALWILTEFYSSNRKIAALSARVAELEYKANQNYREWP